MGSPEVRNYQDLVQSGREGLEKSKVNLRSEHE